MRCDIRFISADARLFFWVFFGGLDANWCLPSDGVPLHCAVLCLSVAVLWLCCGGSDADWYLQSDGEPLHVRRPPTGSMRHGSRP